MATEKRPGTLLGRYIAPAAVAVSASSMSQAIFRSSTLRAIEQRYAHVTPSLMERAGRAAAELAYRLLADTPAQHPILILAGPGNNGGDAFVVARLLKMSGRRIDLIFTGTRTYLPTDAGVAHDAWLAAGGTILPELTIPSPTPPYALAIDGLFGIGLSRPVTGSVAALITSFNALHATCQRLSLDIPSGLDANAGCILGNAIRASHTLTFIGLKPGLLTLDGPDHCGQLHMCDLDLPLASALDDASDREDNDGHCISPTLFADCLLPRTRNSHKGSHGSAVILGGAAGMTGAALLAGRAALRLGAGRVHVGMLAPLPVDPCQPELMLKKPDHCLELANAIAIGPGLGPSSTALKLLHDAIASALPLLLDADALNLLARHPDLLALLPQRQAATLLTPHPLEAARLLDTDLASVQANRIKAARHLARRHQAVTVLKGCGSIVALPDGRWFINTTGNPALASAGSGDVLSGITVALLAQGWPADKALLAAVHLHGIAADLCVSAGNGPIGLTASELMEPARQQLNTWIATGFTTHSTQQLKKSPL